jgi:hypothetical protein
MKVQSDQGASASLNHPVFRTFKMGPALLGSPVVDPPGAPEPVSLVLIGTEALVLLVRRRGR